MKPEPISDQLRKIILASRITRGQICRRAGIDDDNLSRFMRRRRSIDVSTIDRLTKLFGLKLHVTIDPTPVPRIKAIKHEKPHQLTQAA